MVFIPQGTTWPTGFSEDSDRSVYQLEVDALKAELQEIQSVIKP